MKKRTNKCIIFVAICSIILSGAIVARAVDKAYYWDRSNLDNIAGFTTNWSGGCGISQSVYRITNLSNATFGCTTSTGLTRSGAGDMLLEIFPIAYSSNTQIRGINATFYLRTSSSGSSSGNYSFDLGFAQGGSFTSFGNVYRTVNSDGLVNFVMNSISGTAPAGSNLALKVSAISNGGRMYLGRDGGPVANSNSGRFYVNETVVGPPPTPTYNVTIRALPVAGNVYAGDSYIYDITVNNTGNTKGNYTLSLTDSDTTNFAMSTLGATTMEINSGSSMGTTLTVSSNAGATVGAVDTTTVNVTSDENSIYTNSTQVGTTVMVQPPVTNSQVVVKTNRYVVLDDPNTGTSASGFFDPTDVRGGSYNTNYWNGESTTIRTTSLITDSSGTPKPGVNVNFNLRYPNNTVIDVASSSSTTDSRGIAYYSFNLNEQKYWGYWRIDASANVDGTNVQNSASFVLDWWGCPQCHGSQNPGTWGTMYTPKSYYTMGYDFHRSQHKSKHTEAMTDGACIICHQSYNGTAVDWRFTDNSPTINPDNEYSPDWHNGKKKCQDCHAGSNISSTPQGKNPEIAGCYDTAGCHTQKNANLTRVNSTTGYIVGGNYRTNYSDIQNSNVAKAHNDTRVECIVCHGAGHNITKPYNISSTSNTYTENDQCWTCHTNRIATHQSNSNCVTCHSQDAHNITINGGGKDCVGCHDIGKSLAKVDVSKINSTDSIHVNLNSNGNTGMLRSDNRICWGCHTNDSVSADNVVNEEELPSDGHPNGYKTPKNCADCHIQSKFNALPVNAHYSDSPSIKTKSYGNINDSCVNCHNKTEMLIATNTITDPGGSKSIYARVSHYGENKTGDAPYNLAGESNCKYCHNGSSAFTTEMIDAVWNSSINNHTGMATNPSCTNANCHDTGRMHYSTLKKPTVDSTLCSNCHGGKDKHNGTVECTNCHLSSNRNIHPIQYLQKGGTWSTTKDNAVNCTDCHQDNGMSGFVAPIIPGLKHSSNPLNGTIWGNYWTSEDGACTYCHSDTRHNNTGLGKTYVLLDDPENTKNGPLTSTNWCADCHNSGNAYYRGDQWSPVPPTLLPQYHGGMSSYKDENCRLCHTINGPYSETPNNYTHSLDPGGGDNCIACHSIRRNDVNISKFGRHANLSTSDGYGVVSNNDCWTCHYNKDMNNNSIYLCDSCHIDSNGVVRVDDPTLLMPELLHGEQQCKDCHAPVKYHMDGTVGPKGLMDLFSFD